MLIFREKRQFCELTTKNGRQNCFLANRTFFPENQNFFRLESKISGTGFTTPQTSNQIDAAACYLFSGENKGIDLETLRSGFACSI